MELYIIFFWLFVKFDIVNEELIIACVGVIQYVLSWVFFMEEYALSYDLLVESLFINFYSILKYNQSALSFFLKLLKKINNYFQEIVQLFYIELFSIYRFYVIKFYNFNKKTISKYGIIDKKYISNLLLNFYLKINFFNSCIIIK